VLLGEVQGWGQQTNKSKRLAVLASDIAYLQDVLGMRALEEAGTPRLGTEELMWLIQVPKSHIKLLLTPFMEPWDVKPRARQAGSADLQCDKCTFRSTEAVVMAQHKFHTHGERNKFRAMVVGCQCPACGATYTSKRGAENHVAKQTCKESRTEAFVRKAEGMNTERILAKQSEMANGKVQEPASTLHRWFGSNKQREMPSRQQVKACSQAGGSKGKGKGKGRAQAKHRSKGRGGGRGRAQQGKGKASTETGSFLSNMQQAAHPTPTPPSQAGQSTSHTTVQQNIAHYFVSS
jgi:hypothetical protein